MENLASHLRALVSIQQPQKTADTLGGYTRNWQNVADVWADITPLSARDITNERFSGQQIQARITHRVRLRYTAGITTDMRILYEGRALYIRAVVDRDERKERLEILAEEGIGA